MDKFKQMPKVLALLTFLFAGCGLIAIVAIMLPGWRYKNQPISYREFWQSGAVLLPLSAGAAFLLIAVGFYKAQRWARYAVPVGLAMSAVYQIISPNSAEPYEWVGSLFWGILACWYFFRKQTVRLYFSQRR
jgi:hypothetical protein